MLRVGLVQLNNSDDPTENLGVTLGMIKDAARDGAQIVFTPEVTNLVSLDRLHQQRILQSQSEDLTLSSLCNLAQNLNIFIQVGSLALKSGKDDRFVNRGFLIAPDGQISASYDKIHLFDVDLDNGEKFHESAAYERGDEAVLCDVNGVSLGLSICYDVRFPQLYRDLAKSGAELISVPSAFSPETGPSHWEVLLKARAIETGCFIVAAAQTGTHRSSGANSRKTYGHSMIVDPWGDIVMKLGGEPDFMVADLDISRVAQTRAKLPSLRHDRPYSKP